MLRLADLTATEADLIEHFVPVAVDEAGGFANTRETATKTNSLVDRPKAIELPAPRDESQPPVFIPAPDDEPPVR